MTHPSWENLSDFFDPDEFATEAVFNRGEVEIGRVLGIFDDPTGPSSLGEYEHEIQAPHFTGPEDGLSLVEDGDTVSIEGKTFDVIGSPKLDGTGVSVVTLATLNVIFNAGL
ncbi:hypothetical protein AB9F29_16700 [Falsihalocynthiibacter sp. S25ZX9]|uniref:head-tail joining protein n=1 Tax=Falsihalocynthiibacter sp. S25ZX9 TaxID=3240870 RepID=UPI00350EA01C